MAIGIDLAGRTILVCGAATGGIGAAAARLAAKAGATVVIADYKQEIVDETLAAIRAGGDDAHAIVIDLTDAVQTDALIAKVIGMTGRIDGVVNNAGGTREGEWQPLEDTSTEAFRATLNLNLEYVFRVCRDACNTMRTQGTGGVIVNVGSVSSIASAPFHGPYGAAKSGIAALTRTMAFEWGKYGIRANTVQPGMVPSKRVMDRAATGRSGQTGTSGTPDNSTVPTSIDEMAGAIVFLLSDWSSGVSGQTISIDSGLSTKFCGGAREFKVAKFNPATIPA